MSNVGQGIVCVFVMTEEREATMEEFLSILHDGFAQGMTYNCFGFPHAKCDSKTCKCWCHHD